MLCLRRVILLALPNFLPSQNWHPESSYAKWLGIAVNSTAELVLLLTLLGTPFWLIFTLRAQRTRAGNPSVMIDLLLVVLLYGAAYFLLAPPKITAG